MNYYERALELKDETIANRRHIHKNAETGLDLPKTKAYVMLVQTVLRHFRWKVVSPPQEHPADKYTCRRRDLPFRSSLLQASAEGSRKQQG